MAPADTMQMAAQAMAELNVGSIPVCDGDRLIGMVTDRDIAVRGVAQGCAADSTHLDQIMSREVQCCFEDDSVEDVSHKMGDAQVRRMPVLDHSNHLVGILSLGDVSVRGAQDEAGDALTDISAPSEPDRTGLSAASGSAGGGADAAMPGSRKH